MEIKRSTMEKVLKEQENDTSITNPKEPGKAFLYKIVYLYNVWVDKIKRIINRH